MGMYPTSVATGLKPYATTIAMNSGAVVPTTMTAGNVRLVHWGNVNRGSVMGSLLGVVCVVHSELVSVTVSRANSREASGAFSGAISGATKELKRPA